jgi:hypothetical protein
MIAERLARLLDWRLAFGREAGGSAPSLFGPSTTPRLRAWTLLWRFLSAEQRRDLWWWQHFDVIGSDARRYRLSAVTRAYNILDVMAHVRYCAGPEAVPMGDYLLAQKLWLEADAPGLLHPAHSAPGDLACPWGRARFRS